MPQSQLDGRAAIRARIEVLRDGLPVAAFGRRGQAEQNTRANRSDEGIETISGQPVTLIHHDGVLV